MSESKGPIDIGAKLEIKGEVPSHALGRAVHALTDAISPFTEGLGLIGDHIRVQRYDVAIKIAKRAQEIAREEKKIITPPPLKFTIPFIEKSSTETNDDELAEMWSNLLADACDDYDGVHLTYIQILSEISASEAHFLDSLGRKHRIDQTLPSPEQIADIYRGEITHFLYETLEVIAKMDRAKDELSINLIIDEVFGFVSSEICRPIQVLVPKKRSDDGKTMSYSAKSDKGTIAYILQRQSLVAIKSIEIPSHFGDIKIELACLTALGADFVTSCMGRG